MFISNGVVYGGEPKGTLKIQNAKAIDGQMMILTFSNGEKRLFDASCLIGPVFEPLKDPEIFRNAIVEYGIVTWMDGEIDCAPEYMYRHSYEYSDIAI